ncbi:SDR family NAD(P)-dependent oxidoreductase [Arthrobacter sp. NEB 688]|uniref:SDR family NAD(P)-dependent oxidoreductase n=1 Tax=Arthrobacter sp. NEB 688 TaxID=904039 RepID=UPI0015640978|nr:SDR family NAD(P)-dependent oxidoreductase [Arthrobacter sp. NEB 688]QKE82905.1 SDR family oxidoreductase [Arthrobacter sp. NEB 688]
MNPTHPTARTAVVTGAASVRGIGFHTAARFVREGWAVVLLDVDEAGLARAAEALRETDASARVETHALDVTDPSAVRAVADAVASGPLPPVGALCNIAGIPSPASFLEVSLEEWDRVLAVNLTGPFLLSQAFAPQMVEAGYGRVVNMSSVTAQHGGGVFSKTAYAAAKAGVLGLTRGMARELAEHGITVNAVAPGVVDTDIRTGSDEETERALAAAVPLRRQARPQEVAALCVWLASEDAGYITGTTQSINGGTYVA